MSCWRRAGWVSMLQSALSSEIVSCSLSICGLKAGDAQRRLLGLVLGVVGHGGAGDHQPRSERYRWCAPQSRSSPIPNAPAIPETRSNSTSTGRAGGAGAARRTQPRRAGARIGCDLAFAAARSHRASAARRSAAPAARSGEMARAAPSAGGAVGEEALDDAVLERMEGDDDEPAAPASTRSRAASASASSPSSPLTKMRSAWKVRVAGWMTPLARRPTAPRRSRQARPCAVELLPRARRSIARGDGAARLSSPRTPMTRARSRWLASG